MAGFLKRSFTVSVMAPPAAVGAEVGTGTGADVARVGGVGVTGAGTGADVMGRTQSTMILSDS